MSAEPPPRQNISRSSPGSDRSGTTPGELAQLDLHELCAGWRGCLRAMKATSTQGLRLRVARLRDLYLNELQRRNPSGFASWMNHERPPDDPEPFLERRSQPS